MRLGLIGVGVVGGTLRDYFQKNSDHELRLYDPGKGLNDPLEGCDAIFISIPVEPSHLGQDIKVLTQCVQHAKKFTDKVFIRSTVLPGTNDKLKTISMPEFLTERIAYQEMLRLPILVGGWGQETYELVKRIFPYKQINVVSNVEAEISKMAHNCFGAFKVTYFNLIEKLCRVHNAGYDSVVESVGITGFIDTENHTHVPGPDGMHGFGGKCFPSNVQAMQRMLAQDPAFNLEAEFFKLIQVMNFDYRHIQPMAEKNKTNEAQP